MNWMRTIAPAVFILCAGPGVLAQSGPPTEEIPLERCDRLPVVKIAIGKSELRFLVDTAATTMLNLKSFSGGRVKEIAVTSWTGTAATSAREVAVPEMAIGKHRLRELKLPAIDLSPIGNACGGPIDGILGVDLMDRMGVTIDLKRQVASLAGDPPDVRAIYDEMERSMGPCIAAFEKGNASEFEKCLDPEIVMYTPHGEFRGRDQVLAHMQERYFKCAPDLHYTMKLHEAQIYGNALWYSYDYTLETPGERTTGHGMSMCRKTEGRWRILNLHNSLAELAAQDPEKSVAKKN